MKRLITSCFGLGRLPIAPGTWGSIPPVLVFVLLYYLNASILATSMVIAVLALIASVVCVKFAPDVIALTGRDDPGEVVADEFAGQAVTFLMITAVCFGPIFVTAMLGFILFRLFDIIKPWPIRRLEKLPSGWGILADDLLAGVYAGIVLLLCCKSGLVEYLGQSFADSSSLLNIFSAAILGAVQGLTEFLPVSSSGHLVLFENFFNFDPEKPEILLFDLSVHLGTVVAIFIVFRKSIAAFFKNLLSSGKYRIAPVERRQGDKYALLQLVFRIYKKSPSVHLMVLAVVATIVTGVLGLLFKSYFASARGNLVIVALMWIVTGTLLLITDCRKKTRRSLRQFGLAAAVVVGLAQAAAIMPGISRSGATICAAILLGLHRRWAVEFSFLIAIPAILGAAAIQLVKDFEVLSSGNLPISSVLTGSVVAGLVGIIALKLLIKTSRGAKLKYFAFYCYILAGFVLVYFLR